MNATAIAVAILLAAPWVSNGAAKRYADDIAAVTTDRDEALMLVTTARHESDFRADVESCRVTGDRGRAFTLYQLHRSHFGSTPKSLACADNRVATGLALDTLSRIRRAGATPRVTFAKYIGTKETSKRVVDRLVTYEYLQKAVGNGSD
jgi:hypothetical protein